MKSAKHVEKEHDAGASEIARKARRKKAARQRNDENVWYGLGMFGLVGWGVAVPTLIGVAIGLWLDAHTSTRFSWTLTLLFLGAIIGSLNAWYWVRRESRHD
jgi:ATP synthase protein I